MFNFRGIFNSAIFCLGLLSIQANALCKEQNDKTHYAWFVNAHQPVHYCIDRAADFLVSLEDARKDIEAAAAMWRAYYETKNVKEIYRYALNFVYSPTCDESVDLKFYLGKNNLEVKAASEFLHEEGYSFSHLSAYDVEKRWGKGFIWFQNHLGNWGEPNIFRAAVMHHLGHILGTPHVEGTIMQKGITPVYGNAQTDEQRIVMMASIDQRRSLLGSEEVDGKLSPEEFLFLTGKESQDFVKATLTLFLDKKLVKEKRIMKGQIAITHNGEVIIVPLTLSLKDRLDGESISIFSHVYQHEAADPIPVSPITHLPAQGTRATGYSARAYFGSMIRHNGEGVAICLSQNMDNDYVGVPYKITRIDPVSSESIRSFVSLLPYEL